MKTHSHLFSAAIALLLLAPPGAQAHDHLAAGFDGSSLVLFDGSGLPMASTNPATYHLVWRPDGGSFGGYGGRYSFDDLIPSEYPAEYFSFTALSDGQAEIASPFAAPTGTQVWMRILSVSGPAGATFDFWDAGRATGFDTPTVSLSTDGSSLPFDFIVSEPLFGQDQEDQDPWGHVHGRGFTVSQIGLYSVQFQLFDDSGLDLALPSQVYTFQFVTVPEPSSLGLIAFAACMLPLCRRAYSQRGMV